jgi:hypothetical protein
MSSSVAANDASIATKPHTAVATDVTLHPSSNHKRPSVRSSRLTAKRENNSLPPNSTNASIPRSILRASPKYTTTVCKEPVDHAASFDEDHAPSREKVKEKGALSDVVAPPVIRERVSEKPRRPRDRGGRGAVTVSALTSAAAALRIEGYTAGSDSTNEKVGEPLVFNSLSEMMEMAGTLPSQEDVETTPQMIEAELNFSVFDPEEYEVQQNAQNATENAENDDGVDYNAIDNDSEESTTSTTGKDPDDASDDDDVLWSAVTSKAGDDEEDEPAPPPRAFLLFWKALSQWVTPAAVAYLCQLRDMGRSEDETAPPHMAHDVAVARYHAILAMLQVPKMPPKGRRPVEHLLRRMDFSQPTPKFTSAQWQGLSSIVLDMVQWDGLGSLSLSEETPPACQALGMTWDEYRYLVQSSLPSFR